MNNKVKEKGLFLLIGLLIGVLVLSLNEWGLFERLELMTVDLRFKVNEEGYKGDEVVLVAIRPEDIEELGGLPWPRSYHARVIDRLREAGARVILLDIHFTSPRAPEEDRDLVEATRRAGNVLYPVFYDQKLTPEMFGGGPVHVPRLVRNIPELAEAAGQGHINLKEDPDGKIRRVPFALSYQGEIFPTIALLSVLRYDNIPPEEVWQEGNFLYAGDYRIPLDEKGNILINNFGLMGGEGFPWFRFAKVKEGRVPGEFFRDRIVIVGYAATGIAGTDIHLTPRGRLFGITIMASLIDTILRRDFLQYLPFRLNGLILLSLSLASIFIMTGGNFRRNTFLSAGLIIAVGGLAIYLFEKPGIVLEVVPLLTVILSNYTLGTMVLSRKTDLTIREGERRLKIFQEMARTTTSSLGEKGSLDLIVSRLAQAVQAELCILRELDKESGTLRLVATYGLEKDIKDPALLELDLKLAEEAIDSAKPLLIRGEEHSSPAEKISVMCSTLIIKGEGIGTISIHGKVAPTPRETFFTKEDADLFTTLSYEATIAVKNAQLYREVQKLFLEAIASLAATIDAKDHYTEYHSERVALYSLAIAEELGLPQKDKEDIKLAATLHDIGKIGVPESILKKSGELSAEEYEEMKLHPVKGARIMEHIDQLQPVIPGMRHHHERYDGKGYPDGLTGKSIPLIGRIIAVADAYDAMTSARPYRGTCTLERACQEIKKSMSTQFDPSVAEAFLRAFSKGKIPSLQSGANSDQWTVKTLKDNAD